MCLPLLTLCGQAEYRAHYQRIYVEAGPVVTFDDITVSFFAEQFNHAFFRDTTPTAKDKACFDRVRAQRMDWIRALLTDPWAEVYRRQMPDGSTRRIALWVQKRYTVVVQLRQNRPRSARFITAHVVDSDAALAKIRGNPKW